MKVYYGFSQFHSQSDPHIHKDIALTIGNFDGVHLGHQKVIKELVSEAKSKSLLSVIYTFKPHPFEVLFPDKKMERLFDWEDQQDQFKKWGVDIVVIEEFTADFAKLSARYFMDHILLKTFRPRKIIVGDDFNFGKGGDGKVVDLIQFGRQNEIPTQVIPEFQINAQRVSSSQIRKFIKSGNILEANYFLGREFYLRGLVVEGKKRGRTIGFPTANILPTVNIEPLRGVYFTKALWNGKLYSSVTNIGLNPTFESGSKIHVETHLLDFDHEIYGETLHVFFIKYQREERKFFSVTDLVEQIKSDVHCRRNFVE